MKSLNKISKCFFINLDRRKDRLEHIEKNLPFDATRFPAVDSKKIKLQGEIYKLFGEFAYKFTKAEIACSLSHYKLWKQLSQDKESDNYLILEDDVVFDDGFVDFWNSFFSKYIPKNYNLIYLGGCQPWNKPQYHKALKKYNRFFNNVKKNNFFSENDHFWHMTTCSYIISKQAAIILCQYFEQSKINKCVDFLLLRFFEKNELFCSPNSIYHLDPLMAHQLHEEGDNIELDKNSDLRYSHDKFSREEKNFIPKNIFQTWETSKFEKVFSYLTDKIKNNNPEYRYHFFSADQRRDFIKKNFDPEVVECYDRIIPNAFKADLWRYCVMYKFGGIYCDINIVSLAPFDSLINNECTFFAPIDNPRKNKGSLLLNGFFGCTPGCEIIKICIEIIIDNIKNNFWHNKQTDDIIFDYLNFSGPGVLGRALNKFLERKEYESLEKSHGVIHKNNEKINLLKFCKDKETIKDLEGTIILQNKNGSEDLKKLINEAASSYGVKHWGEHLGLSRKPYTEDVCEINPTAVSINKKKYTLYRTESYPQNCPSYYESSCGKKINFYRSRSGYKLELECGKKIDCTFVFENYSYKKSKMTELTGTNKTKIEDIRFIENSFSEENGQLKSLACCTVIKNLSVFFGEKNEDGSWNEKKQLGLKMNTSPGVCEVNLSNGEIKLVCDLNQEGSNIQKNWMIFKNKGEYYCIYSMFPLIYQKSKDIKKISFTEKQKSTTPEKHNATCPIKIGHNKYAMICHGERRSTGRCWSYDKYFVLFDLINNKICNIKSKKINKAKPQHYCSSIINEGNAIKVLCGDSDISNDSFKIINPAVNKLKVKEFIKIKDEWKNFKDYDFLKYISNQIPETQTPRDKFTTYNSGNKIAIVSLYTPEISDYAIHSENSIRDYCEKQNYTFYVYREKLEENSSANWSKAQAILSHINDHDYIVWMDSDTLIFNEEKKFEDIISKASRKFIFATKDIGDNSMLNSGVLIFKNHDYVKGLIKKWRDFDGDKTSLYASGGDQEILCDILKKSDGFGFNRKIFEMNEFNTDPRFVDEDTFILHFMAYPYELKKIFMSYWQNNFLTESL